MDKNKISAPDSAGLRQKTKDHWENTSLRTVHGFSDGEVLKLIHKFEVHQFEADKQNEQLVLAGKHATEVISGKYSEFFDQAPTAYLTLSKDGEIIRVNRIGATLLGAEQSYLESSNFAFFVSDESKPSYKQFLRNVFKSNVQKSCEIFLSVHATRLLRVQLNAIVSGNGEQCLVNIVDVTGYSSAKDVLMDSESFFRETQVIARLGTYTMDISSGKWISSEVLDAIFGIDLYFEKSVDGWISIIHPDWRKIMADYFIREVIGKSAGFEKEYKIIRQNDQAERWVYGIGRLEFNDKGKPVRMIGTIRDVTEQKKTEEDLRKVQKQYHNLVSKIPVGIYILRSKPDGTFALDYASPRMAEMLNQSVESLIGDYQAIFKSIHLDDLEGFMKLNQEGIHLLRPFDWIGRIRIEGTVKWMHFSSSPELLDSGDVLWHGLVVDITGRLKTEAELKYKNEELQKLNAEKDKFFTIIAHDFRGPFNGFLELTKMIADGSPHMTMEKIHEIAHVMRKSASNVYRLLENLLEWTSMQRGITFFNPSVFLLLPKISDAIGLVLEAADKKEISISLDIPDQMRVVADENMLGSIVRNLVSNAVKYTPKRGKIVVAAKSDGGRYVRISVKDTGIGMNKNIIDNLFSLDINTNRTGTEGEPSTGLGLIICKDFVEKHLGKLGVDSEPGKGSTFYFTIPCSAEPEKKTIVQDKVTPGGEMRQIKKLKILIAEDDETSDYLITIALNRISKEFLHSKTGIDTVKVCLDNPDIDLVLMDIQMPGIDGYEATREIRQFNKNVIIIAQTAFAFPGESEKAVEAGCNGYISKPIDKHALLKMIKMYF